MYQCESSKGPWATMDLGGVEMRWGVAQIRQQGSIAFVQSAEWSFTASSSAGFDQGSDHRQRPAIAIEMRSSVFAPRHRGSPRKHPLRSRGPASSAGFRVSVWPGLKIARSQKHILDVVWTDLGSHPHVQCPLQQMELFDKLWRLPRH